MHDTFSITIFKTTVSKRENKEDKERYEKYLLQREVVMERVGVRAAHIGGRKY